MSNIAILGLTGDPVTLGHELMAKLILEECKEIDEVWFQPCYYHWLGKEPVSPQHRLEMCKIASEAIGPKCKVSSFEIDKGLTNPTYEILVLMRQYYRDHRFYFVIGMDNANTLHNWQHCVDLIADFPMIVLSRTGIMPVVSWFLAPPHIYVKKEINLKVSSTAAKDLLRNYPERAKSLLDPKVYQYIREKGLYL